MCPDDLLWPMLLSGSDRYHIWVEAFHCCPSALQPLFHCQHDDETTCSHREATRWKWPGTLSQHMEDCCLRAKVSELWPTGNISLAACDDLLVKNDFYIVTCEIRKWLSCFQWEEIFNFATWLTILKIFTTHPFIVNLITPHTKDSFRPTSTFVGTKNKLVV